MMQSLSAWADSAGEEKGEEEEEAEEKGACLRCLLGRGTPISFAS
jgi:hypothetical protein